MSDKVTQIEKPGKKPEQTTQPQMVKAYVIPVDAMEQVVDALREAPFRYAKPVLNYIGTLPQHDVPFSQDGT